MYCTYQPHFITPRLSAPTPGPILATPTCSTPTTSGSLSTSCSRPCCSMCPGASGSPWRAASWTSSCQAIKVIHLTGPREMKSLTGLSCKNNVKIFSDRVVDNHQEKLVKLLDLFVEQVHNKFNKYAFYFFLCELLNIIITVIMVRMRSASDLWSALVY